MFPRIKKYLMYCKFQQKIAWPISSIRINFGTRLLVQMVKLTPLKIVLSKIESHPALGSLS